ncbi:MULTISPECIES: UDP-N-acetylmuramate dehydrogenase [Arcobacteraceae]|uniref:UDP-N-acetylenolpyruvoylglucosamine reductase n=1 Tax=Aliarcobacter thereius LMG 24486 TaxID=1032240 RepID=A0A1C7WNH0_9BACT|nr:MULTISPECIES: UDP-N-acetylmuramate dehydrogenase [Arcobacteraceae]OCL83054.1 UDP-N-acetylenolpyruvoylglucosamine reductase [Arcobacter porcinus]OCL83455.1 UDP-N-acetylenolpyruvoylglucosamine reductase [Arcobacter porcinus]OCL95118.1 UDP-N-acetylenolpyruvoylglucosamine reductase [Aliarcobacter thereius LMG 24486]QBF16892.1 UDP-N-acetylenolpyruvoylglucosamine reductase [Aliarcobacter thereius LMG 24486]TLS94080.1 UDP-N-acetylmuramate dehydrogenase [Aliarcobacter thereius]
MENYFKTIDFKRYSSIHIGSQKEVLVINQISDYEDYQIIGRGNNLLISPDCNKKFAILGENFDYIEEKENLIYVGCATSSGKLLTYTRKNNIANLEFLAKLPGNLGGLVKMNAGLKSWEIFNYIHSIKTKDGYIKKEDLDFSYRHTNINTIIYEVVFQKELGFSKERQDEFVKMRDNQPNIASAGSCFKNPKNDFAGRVIEAVGLKGYRIGDMEFSNTHANFLVNHGNGTFEDAISLINLAKQKVKEQFNIELETEIIVFS